MPLSVDAVLIGTFFQSRDASVSGARIGIDVAEVGQTPDGHEVRIGMEHADIQSLCSQGVEMGLRPGDELCVCGGRTVCADLDEARIVFLARPEHDHRLGRGGLVLSIHSSSPVLRDSCTVETAAGGVTPCTSGGAFPLGAA